MAARTGASIGVAITITLLGILALTLFVLTMVFFGQAQSERRTASDATQAMQTYVTENERNSERVRAIADRARESRESVVSYLVRELRDTMSATTGNADMSVAALRTRLAQIPGAESNPLTEVIATRDRQIEGLQRQLAQAQSDFEAANEAREALAQQVNELDEQFREAGAGLEGQVTSYAQQVQGVQTGFGGIAQRYEAQIREQAEAFAQRQDELRAQLDTMNNENLVLQDQIRRLRGEGVTDRVRPLDEASLVDGAVDRVDAARNEVILSIGRQQKVVLGMTFGVFSDATAIRPDPQTGAYQPGKATVEIISVEPNFSRARIISESRGNPIVRGDVVANAVYDPEKTYKMVVYGLFDRNNDGLATAAERNDVVALITAWGGQVVEEIEGDIDFLILGQRPKLGPPPDPDDPIEVVLEYNRLRNLISRYDDLLVTAQATSVPVLNENRLRTLIGDYPD